MYVLRLRRCTKKASQGLRKFILIFSSFQSDRVACVTKSIQKTLLQVSKVEEIFLKMAQPTKRILPPLLEESTFDKVLDKLSEIVGEPNISRNHLYGNLEGPQGQNCYDDLWPLGNPTDHTPSGAVRPKTVNEIQQVLQIANEYKLPLWTVSRGRNLGYVNVFFLVCFLWVTFFFILFC